LKVLIRWRGASGDVAQMVEVKRSNVVPGEKVPQSQVVGENKKSIPGSMDNSDVGQAEP
jgi:hypothetical protein